MSDLKTFSFKTCIEQSLAKDTPLEDVESSKKYVVDSIEKLIYKDSTPDSVKEEYKKNKLIFSKILDSLFILFQSPNLDVEEELANSMIDSLETMKQSWILCMERKTINVYGGYNLYVDVVPIAIQFYKHLWDINYITQNTRVSRSVLQKKYTELCPDQSYRFAHVLFALSWLNLLRVHNSNTILFNQKTSLDF